MIPGSRLLALIEPRHPKTGRSRRPLLPTTMLRVYFLQQWFDLSDPQTEDMLYDSEAMRRFAQIEVLDDRVPDETTILRFRHLLKRHQLTASILTGARGVLIERRLLLKTVRTRGRIAWEPLAGRFRPERVAAVSGAPIQKRAPRILWERAAAERHNVRP